MAEHNMELEEVDPSVEFLYRTMLQRDPKKRRVKPVQRHLIQVDFGGGDDSDDDSDFDVEKHHKGSDDSDAAELSDKEDNNEDDDEDDSDDDDDDSDSSSEDEEEYPKEHKHVAEGPDIKTAGLEVQSVSDTKQEVVPSTSGNGIVESSSLAGSSVYTLYRHKQIRVTICCVCLGDISEEDDEIVECDNCGVSVHEGCYGISENQSNASTESSASTEPWFCDACKADCKPTCELCPNPGGIFKETDAGKWVHLVCALYTPGVAFGDVDKLSPVTLFEMPYSRWGARECSLCEDARFSRTGVCISCDAGMCRTYFHVTCAQKEGLLSEAAPEECMDIADPFFAYCKMHADKMMARAKRRNWLAIQSHIKKHTEKVIEDEKEKMRFDRKLNRHRQKYKISKFKRPPSWVPTQKLVRYLTSSPSCVKKMLRKAELMGIITQVQHVTEEKQEMRKKTHILPALSVEFISYYLERNSKIDNIKRNITENVTQNSILQKQENVLRRQYNQLLADVDRLKDHSKQLKQEGENMYGMLTEMAIKPLPMPEMFNTKRAPVKTMTRQDSVPCASPPAIINPCAVCKKSCNPHLLVRCDLCKKHYHLGCLEPPLTRMPKKTKLMGWQCSQCDNSSSGPEEGTKGDINAPRRLREKIKEPFKWSPDLKYEFEKLPAKYSVKGGAKKGRQKKRLNKEDIPAVDSPCTSKASLDTSDTAVPILKTEPMPEASFKLSQPPPAKKQKGGKEEHFRGELMCAVCNGLGDYTNTVSCDECKLSYHFGCLDPPAKKSPKQRGYSWHCEACDPTDNSGDEEEEEDMEDDGGSKSDGNDVK
ncbi:PHD finger protein 14 [Mizuhopecten yessoensis]|uniref:PHD finger protein 14 n=1 Tax=Mizuhopecten yessoensis TaxID=6573 RepID=A0A210PGW1_MIZYE|nr:PHD finger protein 14 [Mizuhopecten yessoensis]